MSPVRRSSLANRVAEVVGGGILEITARQSGWPALGTLKLNGRDLPISLFAAPVGSGNRGRDEFERRFQNPGSDRPIVVEPDRYPLLLGILEADLALEINRPLLALADPFLRAGNITRFSIFVGASSLREAKEKGWSVYRNSADEVIRIFFPQLLPIVVSGLLEDAVPPTAEMQTAIDGSGLAVATDIELPAAAERARRATSALVRNSAFGRRVITAYGSRCAMCGLDADLVQAAHIYPVSAPGSRDEPWNGLSLCPNHHLAFDRHIVAVQPETREILFSPMVHSQVDDIPAMRAFVQGTFARLADAQEKRARPTAQIFIDRYSFYHPEYEWMGPESGFQ